MGYLFRKQLAQMIRLDEEKKRRVAPRISPSVSTHLGESNP
jgi:phenylpyruvate tautomerase PptA (4-oxalocrotonate tautomerase family)